MYFGNKASFTFALCKRFPILIYLSISQSNIILPKLFDYWCCSNFFLQMPASTDRFECKWISIYLVNCFNVNLFPHAAYFCCFTYSFFFFLFVQRAMIYFFFFFSQLTSFIAFIYLIFINVDLYSEFLSIG